MKLLATTVGGMQIESPSGVAHLTPSKTGIFGQGILQLGIQLLLLTVVVLSLFYLIWGGIQWIMSGGEKQGVEAARAKIMYAIIGLVLSLFSFFIISTIGYFFGINLLAPANTTTIETPGGPR